MNFGFSVGDFVTVLQLANQVRKRWVDAPIEYATIRNETRALDNVLRDIDDLRSHITLNTQQDVDLRHATLSCEQVLQDLEAVVKKYGSLQQKGTDLKDRVRKTWSRVRLDAEAIASLRDRLQSAIALLGAVHDSIQRTLLLEVKTLVTDRHEDDRSQQRDSIANWFAAPKFADDQVNYLLQRSNDTGTWPLQHSQYLDWLSQSGATLLCQGIPGAGKTVLAATIVDDLRSRFSVQEAVVAYFYCNYKRPNDQKLDNVLSIFVRQLFQERPFIPKDVMDMYKEHQPRQDRPTTIKLISLLMKLAQSLPRTFIIVDALDEYINHERQRDDLVDAIFGLQRSSANVHFLATTRHNPDILNRFANCSTIEIKASETDIKRYLDGRLRELPPRIATNTDLCLEIQSRISILVGGMFLLARLHFDSLQDKTTPVKVRKALEDLPQGTNALSTMYASTLQRIDNQLPGIRELAHTIFTLITYSRYELTIDEIRHAIAIEADMEPRDLEDGLEDDATMIAACAGLVVLDPESQTLRLVHYTAQEYLMKVRNRWLPDGHTVLARKCLEYLSMDVFGCGWIYDDPTLEPKLTKYKFLPYAALNYGFHVRDSQNHQMEEMFMDFVKKEQKFQFSTQYHRSRGFADGTGDLISPGYFTPLHMAAGFDLAGPVQKMIAAGFDPNQEDSNGDSALSWAAFTNSLTVLTDLVNLDGIKLNKRDFLEYTPILHASRLGFTNAFKILASHETVLVDIKDSMGMTPLAHAAHTKNTDLAQFLIGLETVNLESRDGLGWTVFAHAAAAGAVDIMQMLLDTKKVDANTEDNYFATPLFHAASRGRSESVRFLLARTDIVADSKDGGGVTPLMRAVWFCDTHSIKLFLERKDVDITYRDGQGHSVLGEAVKGGKIDNVKLILETGLVDVNVVHTDGRGPLLYATLTQSLEMVELLLAFGADPNSVSDRGQSALTHEIFRIYEEHDSNFDLIRLLLKYGADVNLVLRKGRTALTYAMTHETVNLDLVKLLLDYGADPNMIWSKGVVGWGYIIAQPITNLVDLLQLLLKRGADPNGRHGHDAATALISAIGLHEEPNLELVKMLLAHGADPNLTIRGGGTALMYAAAHQSVSVAPLVRMLLDFGAEVNAQMQDGRHPLRFAIKSEAGPKLEIVRLLLEHGANPNLKDHEDKTVLMLIVTKGDGPRLAVIDALLDHGADPNIRSQDGLTALMYAVDEQGGGDVEIVKSLLKHGSDLSIRSESGQTALALAMNAGRGSLVDLLKAHGARSPIVERHEGRTFTTLGEQT